MAGERGWGFGFVLLCPHSLHVFQVLPSHSRLHDVEVLLQTNFRLVLLSSSSNQSSLTLSALPKHHYVPGSNFEQMKNWNIYKIEGRLRFMSALYVHRMISIGIRNLQIVMERAAHLLPSHQAFHQPWGDPRARAPDRSRICINSKSIFFPEEMKTNAFLPPSAGFFPRVHEGDLVEEIIEVKANVNLWRLLFFIFISIVPVTTIIIAITTIINRLNRLGSMFLLPEKRGQIKQGPCW